MGKISKHSNLYKDNVLIRSVNSKGVLEKYTLKEVQDLVDKLGTEKDENGRIKDQEGFNNASYILMQMYNDPEYNDEKENFIKELNDRLRVNKEEVGRYLDELDKGLQQGEADESSDTNSEREAVQVSGEDGDNKGRKTGDDAIKFNLNGQEVTMSKTDIEKDKKMSKGAFLKSYDVNDNKEEYVEYKEN
ncbi:hypothetical protein [Prevotella jejuni]|jgi:hypothetical protein|uniref:hypothetical protein n=1 Tax=Prevotella jejuni TaxID=1177574 RepID=UPI003211AF94